MLSCVPRRPHRGRHDVSLRRVGVLHGVAHVELWLRCCVHGVAPVHRLPHLVRGVCLRGVQCLQGLLPQISQSCNVRLSSSGATYATRQALHAVEIVTR